MRSGFAPLPAIRLKSDTTVLVGFLAFMLSIAPASSAQTFTNLANFNFTNGDAPIAPLVQGIDGNFYGTTLGGGQNNGGTIFQVTPSGTITVVHNLQSSDGTTPNGGLTQAIDGTLYGTAAAGGANSAGTVFKVTTAGTLTVLHSFTFADGSGPIGQLLQASDGNFYGVTNMGGANTTACQGGCGTVFKISPAGTFSTLHSFCSQPNCTDGALPAGTLVEGADGYLYGATYGGGAGVRNNCIGGEPGCGTVFRVSLSGQFTTIYNFCSQSDCADGALPNGNLVQALDGNFYGTTESGGQGYNGLVFKMTPGGAVSTLYTFCSQPNCADGEYPSTGLVIGSDGSFYGTAYNGGTSNTTCQIGCGTLYKITRAGAFTVLHAFNGSDGYYPNAPLIQASNGIFYGTTQFGGQNHGTVFSLNMGTSSFIFARPPSGQVGTQVQILGNNLTEARAVAFNGTPATTFQIVSDSEITATVPAGASTGKVQVALTGNSVYTNGNFQVTGPSMFYPVTPCRLIDTRSNGGPIQGGTSRTFQIPQLGGCNIPSSASAYSLNVTVVPQRALGYLTIWPQGNIQPDASTMNSFDGRTKANAAIVPAGNNAVNVYVSDTSDVILDTNGYFNTSGTGGLQFYPLPPCRIVDTRNGQDGGTLQAGVERDYNIAGNCGVPGTAAAYSFNVTVLPVNGGLGYLSVWPKGESQPNVSTLNDPTGTIVANAAIVPAGPDNATAFYANNNNTDLLLDVNGYFAPPGSGSYSLYTMSPCRALDTRQSGGGFSGRLTVDVVDSACAPSPAAKAYLFNATVVPPGPMLYLTLWPNGQQQPGVSTLNAPDGSVTSNMAIVPTNDGSIDAYAAGLTQMILDISGYFAP